MQRISNHPVHIISDEYKEMSPSAFIPFCSIGGDRFVMGRSHDKFDIPVCDKFRRAYVDGQLCYQVDVNELKNRVDKNKVAYEGIEFLLDYNFDRMVNFKEDKNHTVEDSSAMEENNKNMKEAMIYIDTLGKNEPLFGEGNYVLTEVTEIDGTEAFMQLDEGIRHCQNKETFQECQAQGHKTNGQAACQCTPYKIRDYSKTVSCIY
jgi:hypothetical protein